jgi:hypothetical protein
VALMTRYVVTVRNELDKARVMKAAARVPVGYRVEFKEPKRSDVQNDRMWAMLGDISKQATINGKSYEPEQWKCVFMKAMGKDAQFLPTLDGNSFFPTGFRSSDLSVREMSDLQTFMEAWAAENGIALRDVAA